MLNDKGFNIVNPTGVYPGEISEEEILKRMAKIGYTRLDLTMAGDHYDRLAGDDWREWTYNARETAEKLGVRYTHSHANAYAGTRGMPIIRCFDICRELGIRYTVVHPDFLKSDKSYYEDLTEFVQKHVELYQPIIEMAEKYQVTVLTENLLWGQSANLLAMGEMVKAINSPYFGWCFDTGHLHAVYGDKSIDEVAKVTVPPLSLHTHDNHGEWVDEHSLPGDGTIDWKKLLDLLKKMGYQGDLVLEAHHQSIAAPDEQRDEILADLFHRAEKMRAYYLGETTELKLK